MKLQLDLVMIFDDSLPSLFESFNKYYIPEKFVNGFKTRDLYRQQFLNLRSIVKSCSNEIGILHKEGDNYTLHSKIEGELFYQIIIQQKITFQFPEEVLSLKVNFSFIIYNSGINDIRNIEPFIELSEIKNLHQLNLYL